MKRGILFKVVQRQTLTCLSHKYGIYFAFAGIVIVLYSMFQFGEELMIWSQSQYDSMFSFYHDNIAGNSYQRELCSPIPIDIVYTWVNGSDPSLIQSLNKVMLQETLNKNENHSLLATLSSINQPLDCNLENCLTLPCIIVPAVVSGSRQLFDESVSVLWSFEMQSNNGFLFKNDGNATILRFENGVIAADAFKQLNRKNVSDVRFLQVTSEAKAENSMKLANGFIITGIPGKLDTNEVIEKLPTSLKDNYDWVHMEKSKNTAFIWAKNAKSIEDVINAKGDTNKLEIDEHVIEIHRAFIVDLKDNHQQSNEASKSRFEDNEELRYSLRSLEKYAPWVRNIYIVTNGQIPHWLNIDNPRITIVTHEEIFPNKSHLPSFSSPSIESHLHRIPGLSQKFIYFNDDVMFGKEVWPDDFYTHSFGQKVYLTWSVPNCNEGCAASWIKDGFCDSSCNVSACMWDGGDCTGKNVKAGIDGGTSQFQNTFEFSRGYCYTGCSNAWLADKYCDQACNHVECAFDAGDCGISHFDQLYRIEASNETVYQIPLGFNVAYMDISKVFDKVTSASYDKTDESLRIAAVSNVHHLLTFLYYGSANYTNTAFNITGEKDDEFGTKTTFTLLFNVTAYPSMNITQEVQSTVESTNVKNDTVSEPEEEFLDFSEFTINEDMKKPKTNFENHPQFYRNIRILNLTALPEDVQLNLSALEQEHEDGFLTEVGYAKKKYDLVKQYKSLYSVVELKEFKKHVQFENSTDHLKGDMFELTTKSQVRSIQQLRKDIQAQKKNTFHDFLKPNQSLVGGMRKLMSYEEDGFLPWEQDKSFQKYVWEVAADERKNEIHDKFGINDHKTQRHLLSDSFAESLRYVSNIFNQDFGFNQRKVPAHMPHMIDRLIMEELQSLYPEQFAKTSAHKLRHPEDMQFAFSYFYYLMEKKKSFDITAIFKTLDTDLSGVLSDRELRVLATRLHELPLTLEELTKVENTLKDCAWELYGPKDKNVTKEMRSDLSMLSQTFDGIEPSAITEQYYDKKLPPVTLHLIKNCKTIVDMINSTYKKQNKYKFQLMEQDEVAFKMIGSNVSVVVGQLDSIRKNPRKFICLNDNIDHHASEARMVKAVLGDFYETLFPLQSQFELPLDYRNRFANKNDLVEWQKHRDQVTFWLRSLLGLLIFLSFGSMVWDYFYNTWKKHKYKFTRGRNPFFKLWRLLCRSRRRSTSSELIP